MKKELKTAGRLGLDATIIASKILKYGAHLSFGVSKCFLNGATSLASSFSGSTFKLGLGDFLLKETENGVNLTFDQAIKLQNYLKGKLR